MMMKTDDVYVKATYMVEDKADGLGRRAEGIAVGLTVGSWTDLPAAKQSDMEKYRGRVEDIRILGDADTSGRVKAHITIGYPIANLTPTIPALLTTVFGKLSMDGQIRLVDLELPDAFIRAFPGPKFGVEGIRSRFKVHQRPFLMSIFKSCIGLSLGELTQQFRDQALGGVDFIKDDEIFFSEALVSPEQRVPAFVEAARQAAEVTGKTVGYAVNLTGSTRKLFDRAKRLADLGAGALLLNVFAYGLDVLQELAADADISVPVMVHPAVAGAMYASGTTGIAADILLGTLTRLAGADIVIYPSPYGSVTLEKSEGLKLVSALRQQNGLRVSLPAPSAGIHPGMVPTLLEDVGIDLIVNAGGGIHGHPGGASAGGRAFSAAIDATVANISLAEAAETHLELAQALQKWGGP